MARAKETRLAIKAVRVAADKARVSLKDESLRKGKAIDGVFNGLRDALAEHETYLQSQEEFAQRAAEQRRREIKADRDGRLAAMGVYPATYNTELMTPEAFEACMAGIVAQQQAVKDAAEKAEADRVAQAKADAEAREAQRVENERLRAEAVAREKDAAIEREKSRILREAAEAKAELERRAREDAERKLKAKADAERKQKADEAAAARKAASAPDREKLLAWADRIGAVSAINVDSPEAKRVVQMTSQRLADVIAELASAANRL